MRCAKKFGSVVVEYIRVEITANYEIRSFDVYCNREKRHVRQYHYVNWPEGGVPLHFKSLVPFCRKITTLVHGTSPIVVHSSVGIGRTGTFILCDICLCMAKAKGNVDVFHYLQKLREQRVNMVDNVRQYILVHWILLQCLLRKDTGIACNNRLKEIVENITDAKTQEEMNVLEDIIWQSKAIRNANPQQHIVVLEEKNRFKNIVPDPSSAVQLSLYPPNNELSAYINAVLVDSYQIASKFIVTQNPLLSTVPDFWRMVVENRVTTIVLLNRLNFDDATTTIFYPLEKSCIIEPLPYLEVQYVGKEIKGHYEVFDLVLARLDIQEDDVAIKIIQINNWDYRMMQPENPSELIKVYEEMNHLGICSDKIILSCYDGARASGLFAALCFLIDRIKLEQICDVPLAVSTVRQSRKQFVRDPSQFLCLYKCA
ncbi:tyrosine phosphatase, partial [Oryctes borbonicus]